MARLFVESIFGLYRTRGRRDGLMGGECGAVTFVQRFGGSLNLNVHMHVVVLDGVFVRDADHGVVFHAAPPPTLVDLEAIVRHLPLLLSRAMSPIEFVLRSCRHPRASAAFCVGGDARW